ncbi:MAG: di-trans,poly-cis-decaprenylcistransferase [Corynebacteriales bacterium]|nr:di-trans,poly-cis-decaprenylcistransferase [Mycobacteriales bacterium]
MDGNGRWAKQRGLQRTEGHRKGEAALNDIVEGCIELGIPYLTAFVFSTENWRRSPDEVRFILGYSRKILRARRDLLHAQNVKIQWMGRRSRLWSSVSRELDDAAELTKNNTGVTLTMCMNYGGRAEIADAAAAIARDVAAGVLKPNKVDEDLFARYLAQPELPDVDLFLRTSGEQRISNFLLWQSAFAEFVFDDTLFPDFDRSHLRRAVEAYGNRERRFGAEAPISLG